MIRPAAAGDVPAILGMGRRFVAEAWKGLLEFHEPSVLATVTGLMERGILLVAERDGGVVGMIGAALARPYLDARELVAHELFWWVEPEARGDGLRLVAELQRVAKERGATLLGMNAVEGMRGADVARVYERRGLRPVERTFLTRL